MKFVVIFFMILCTIIAVPSSSAQRLKSCNDKRSCEETELCKNNKCVNACDATRNYAVTNALCTASNHNADWSCPDGYTGSPSTICSKSCYNDADCAFMDVCAKTICTPGCHFIVCRHNQDCFTFNHEPTCY